MPTPYTSSPTSSVSYTGDSTLNALIGGSKWGGGVGTAATISFSFPMPGSVWEAFWYSGLEPNYAGYRGLMAAEQTAFRAALQTWADVANITFVEVAETPSEVGDIRVAFSGYVGAVVGAAAYTYYPNPDSYAGDIWIDPFYAPNLQLQPGQFGFSTMIHEIGHTLGLDHPFLDQGDSYYLTGNEATQMYSIMGYDLSPYATIEAAGPMLYDILAIQHIYGANMSFHTGDDSYTFSNSKEELKAIWDAGGIDTFDASNQTRAVKIDLNEGHFSSIGIKSNGATAQNNIAIAFGVTIENATGGSGSDTLTGNAVANTLIGNDGNDILDGKAGADHLIGGKGADTYVVDEAGDVVDESVSNAAGGGVDTVQSAITFDLTGHANIEHLTLTGKDDVNATGNALVNNITGNEGANFLDGGAGNDTLTGGKGNDTYILDNIGDKVIESLTNAASGGIDKIEIEASYSLAVLANIDNLTLKGSGKFNGTGNALNNTLTGNDGNNVLDGGTGNDTLIGGAGNDKLIGGLGNDALKGGTGNDIYVIDSLGDWVDEENNADTDDEVISSQMITSVGAFEDVEHFTYTAGLTWTFTATDAANKLSGGSGIDKLSGGLGNDTLLGNAGNDELDGGADDDMLDGGAGTDKLTGGAGNDVYVVDSIGDTITELGADTDDLVKSTVTYTLASGLEHLTLLGTGVINATGNNLANTLTGNDGANILDGKAGADHLIGGKGADTYVVDEAGDVVDESVSNAAGGGVDLVKSAITFDLTGHANIEHVTLTDKGDVNATGNALNNILTGNEGANRLDGGLGNDTLIGGKGNDIYVVNSATDIVTESLANALSGGEDTIESSITWSLAALANIDHLTLKGSGNFNGTGNALNNTLTGNDGNNVLDGGAGNDTLVGAGGNDTLNGGTGNDVLIGGAGNDIYLVDSLFDTEDEEGNTDTNDEIRTTVPIVASVAEVEHYTYSGAAAWTFTGTDAANILKGGAGIDKLFGGLGNDTLLGNAGNDELDGGADDDTLDGGLGTDKLAGGAGNDVYIIDSIGDTITELGADTDDLVKSTVTYTLASGLEHLTLLGTGVINATGNNLANTLTGNDGANILDGKAGADHLIGGKGADTYVVDEAGDVVDETITNALGGGIDTVKTAVNFDMADDTNGIHSNLDNVTLLAGATTVTGNALNNVISGAGLAAALTLAGGGGNDSLTGGLGADQLDGGTQVDILIGGKGDDSYLVDLVLAGTAVKLEDTVTEAAGEGTDTIELRAAGDFGLASATTLLLGANIENLDAGQTGSNKLNLTGNTLGNHLTGNDSANVLDGGSGSDTLDGGAGNDSLIGGAGNDILNGGSGADTMTGGLGVDTFRYTAVGEGDALEVIKDFAKGAGGDVLDFSDLLDSVGASSDAFGDGYIDLSQVGADTVVTFDADGTAGAGSSVTLVTLKNIVLMETDPNFFL